jgi:parallel beta-helix repeat protein
MALWCTFGVGCDSDSSSQQNVQYFPQSPTGATTTLEVPADYATIQDAVDEAEQGDIVRVAAGTYTEDITITSEHFSLRGAGKGLTTIRGMVRIYDSTDVSFEGFAVQDGGIHARTSSVIITGNKITLNPGPGLWLDRCPNVLVSDNNISQNGREGILIDASHGVIGSNSVTHNTTDGIVINDSSVQVVANRIVSNGRDGVAVRSFQYRASPNLLQNLIRQNGGSSNYDIICFGGNTNPTGVGNTFDRCINCAECHRMDDPATYTD